MVADIDMFCSGTKVGELSQFQSARVVLKDLTVDCRRPSRYVPYKGTFVPYDGTYGAPDQGQTLDV